MSRPIVLHYPEVDAIRQERRRLHLAPVNGDDQPWDSGEKLTVRPYRARVIPPGSDERPPGPCRIVVGDVTRVPLEALTSKDAQLLAPIHRAGVADLARWFMDRYDDEWKSDPLATRNARPALVVMGRWKKVWHQREAWRVELALDPVQPRRLLAIESQYGYTENVARGITDAGEALTEADQAQVSADVRDSEIAAARTARLQRLAGARAAADILNKAMPTDARLPRTERRRNRLIAHQAAQAIAELERTA